MKNIITLVLAALTTLSFSQNQELIVENGKYFNVNGTLFSGQYAQFQDGYKIAELSVEDGILSGSAMYYHKNGSVKEEGHFSEGKRSGKWYQYNDLGNISTVAAFKADKKHGKWIVWDENGEQRFEMYYEEGQKVGTWKMWDSEGKLTTKTFKQ